MRGAKNNMSWNDQIKTVLEQQDSYEYYLCTNNRKNMILVDKSYLTYEKLLPRVVIDGEKVYFLLPFDDQKTFALFAHGINDYNKETIRELYNQIDYIGESSLTHKVILRIGYKYRYPIYIRSMRQEYMNSKYPNLTGLDIDLEQKEYPLQSHNYANLLDMLICPNYYRYVLTNDNFKTVYLAAEKDIQAQYVYAYSHTIMYAYIHEVLVRKNLNTDLSKLMFTLDNVDSWLHLNCDKLVNSPYTPMFFDPFKNGALFPHKHTKILSNREEFNVTLATTISPIAYNITNDIFTASIGVLYGPVLTQALLKYNAIKSSKIEILTTNLTTVPFFIITAIQKYGIERYTITHYGDNIQFLFDKDSSIKFTLVENIERHVLLSKASCDRAFYDGEQVYMFASCAITSMNGGMLLENSPGDYNQEGFNRMCGQHKLVPMINVGIQNRDGIVQGFNSNDLKTVKFEIVPTQQALDALDPIIDDISESSEELERHNEIESESSEESDQESSSSSDEDD